MTTQLGKTPTNNKRTAFSPQLQQMLPSEQGRTQPSHESIANRAYDIWLKRGAGHGRDWQDWFEAEKELGYKTTSLEKMFSDCYQWLAANGLLRPRSSALELN